MGRPQNELKPGRCDLTVVVPALNEQANLASTLEGLLDAIARTGIEAEVIVFNDGSTDKTGDIAEGFAQKDRRVRVAHHTSPKGIGSSFCEALQTARGEFIAWFPGDGENDPAEFLKFFGLTRHVDVIVPYVINTGVRPLHRRVISSIYCAVINISFRTHFNYTNGNNIYRTSMLRLIRISNRGFLCSTEMLLKLVKGGALYAEVPVLLRRRKSGKSKAFSFKSIIDIVNGYCRLFVEVNILKKVRCKRPDVED